MDLWTKFSFFEENLNFWPKFFCEQKTWICEPNLDFWTKLEFVWIVWFLTIQIVQKIQILFKKSKFCSKIRILFQKSIFGPKVKMLFNIYVFQNIQILFKNLNLVKNQNFVQKSKKKFYFKNPKNFLFQKSKKNFISKIQILLILKENLLTAILRPIKAASLDRNMSRKNGQKFKSTNVRFSPHNGALHRHKLKSAKNKCFKRFPDYRRAAKCQIFIEFFQNERKCFFSDYFDAKRPNNVV